MVNGWSAIPLEKFFEMDTSGRTRGHSLKLRKKRCEMDIRKYFFSSRVVDRWNALDEKVVTAGSLNLFKEMLKKQRRRRDSTDLLLD